MVCWPVGASRSKTGAVQPIYKSLALLHLCRCSLDFWANGLKWTVSTGNGFQGTDFFGGSGAHHMHPLPHGEPNGRKLVAQKRGASGTVCCLLRHPHPWLPLEEVSLTWPQSLQPEAVSLVLAPEEEDNDPSVLLILPCYCVPPFPVHIRPFALLYRFPATFHLRGCVGIAHTRGTFACRHPL